MLIVESRWQGIYIFAVKFNFAMCLKFLIIKWVGSKYDTRRFHVNTPLGTNPKHIVMREKSLNFQSNMYCYYSCCMIQPLRGGEQIGKNAASYKLFRNDEVKMTTVISCPRFGFSSCAHSFNQLLFSWQHNPEVFIFREKKVFLMSLTVL